jgi:diguanylate cyclase
MNHVAAPQRYIASSGSRLRLASFAFALVIAALASFSGLSIRSDEQLRLLRDNFRPQVASGKIAIIEIDAKSLAAVSDWPWSRHTHAALVDRLRQAGAKTIAFDIDFSATTNPADDQALTNALARAGGSVILPTFRQPVSLGSTQFSENLPIAPLREHAFLGSVNVQPDADGQLRRYSYGTITGGTPRPSIAALLTGSQGNIEKSFRIDTAINPATLPRVSAIDVLNGRSGAALKGRTVLIGATAIEMGDRYVVPGHGVLPGVVVQALAAETLFQGTANPDWGPWPALLFAALGLGLCIRTGAQKSYWPVLLGGLTMIAAASIVVEVVQIGSVQIVPALLLLALDSLLIGLLGMRTKLSENRLTDAVTGLPNARALERRCRALDDTVVTVVRLSQFDELAAVLGEADRASLMTQVFNRLAVAFPTAQLHSLEAGTIAWPGDVAIESDDADAAAALFRAPIALASRAVLVSPVFGVSRGNGKDAAHLLARASIAARQAQAAGQRWAFESMTLSRDADRSIALIADVESAIANDEIYVVYQAKWDLAAARISGAEALVRWHHPKFGPLSPDAFIPVLESNGQMRLLTLAVVDTCLSQLHRWHAQGNNLGIAINVSATLLDDREFIADLTARLKARGSLASYLTLEVTESATIASTKIAVAALTAFRALGARVSIDDYGTGQATLAYLKSFPTDEIKIDKSFVTNMLSNNGDEIVVRSTIELAHELGFKVVAEGVEDAACLDRLRDYGCDTAQGWAIGKPVRADAFLQISRAA